MKFCRRPFYYAYLAPKGEVWPCGWIHYTIGNLYEQDLKEIWHSEAAEIVRKSILDGSFAYCRKTSCPFLERNEIDNYSIEEITDLAVTTDTPEHISISNDRICNIACTSCRTSVFASDKAYRKKINDVLESILPYANKAKIIDLNGNGEFLANKSFLEFLENLKPEHDDASITLQTNGILFDEKHWEHISHLSKYDLRVMLTINSVHRDTYRYISGGFDKLDQVLNNISLISTLRKEDKIKLFNIVMVVQECNFHEIPNYVQLFAHSGKYTVDEIIIRPVYKWFGMTEETYWFKNILNPLHPYHKEYLKILDDDCWNDPKVYDWGCHNIREARPHPLTQEKEYNSLLLGIYENSEGIAPTDHVKRCMERTGIAGKRIGIFGDNRVSGSVLRLMQQAGADIRFRLTWFSDEEADVKQISMQSFRPEMADVMLLLDYYDKSNLSYNLRTLKFNGPILTMKDLLEGSPE